jgi:hypothetical protein
LAGIRDAVEKTRGLPPGLFFCAVAYRSGGPSFSNLRASCSMLGSSAPFRRIRWRRAARSDRRAPRRGHNDRRGLQAAPCRRGRAGGSRGNPHRSRPAASVVPSVAGGPRCGRMREGNAGGGAARAPASSPNWMRWSGPFIGRERANTLESLKRVLAPDRICESPRRGGGLTSRGLRRRLVPRLLQG